MYIYLGSLGRATTNKLAAIYYHNANGIKLKINNVAFYTTHARQVNTVMLRGKS